MQTSRRPLLPRRVAWVLLGGLLLAPPAGALGDDADDIAAAIVRKTPNRAEAARKILDAARAMTDSYAVQLRLCEKAYEQAMTTSAGYPTAIAALNLLEKIAPSRSASCRDKRIEVYRLQYYRSAKATKADNGRLYIKGLLARARVGVEGDNWKDAARYYRQAYQVARALNLAETKDIYQDMRTATGYEMVHNRIEVLRAALARDDDDRLTRKQLVMAHLVDLDKPAEAAKYLSARIDPVLHKNVTLATKPGAELADEDFFTLALWYRKLSGQAALKHTKVAMLLRAQDNVELYLAVYTRPDAKRLRAKALATSIETELKKLGAFVARRANLPAGAVLFLTFERRASSLRLGRTTIRDESGAKHDGTVVGGTFAPRAGGRAMVFDGKSYIDMGNPPGLQITGDMTICMWINPANLSARQNPINKAYGGEGTWTLEPNGIMSYWHGSSGRDQQPYAGYTTRSRLQAGQWTHLALVRDMQAKTVTWYADGKVVFAGRAQHAVKASANHLLIGKGYVRNFQGMLDDVGVFKRALSADEIRRLAGLDRTGVRS